LNASLKPVPVDRMADAPYRIDAVLFDFDGTLTRPGALDFSVIKRAIGCPDGTPVLEYMGGVDDRQQRADMDRQLNRFELDGAAASRPNHGTEQLVATIRKAGLPVGILTRNSRESVVKAMENFSTLSMADIDVIVTREDPVRIKPSGEGVLLAAEKMGVDPAHVLMVGDFEFDVQAGRHAGALTAYLSNGRPVPDDIGSRFVVDSLPELEAIIADGVSLPAGKLPNPFLDTLLSRYRIEDPSVIVGPSVGEDTAAVDIAGEAVLVLKTDPITFATESIGRYAVSVNANDMATAGAAARWMLATLLLPCGFSCSQVRGIFADLHDACTDAGHYPVRGTHGDHRCRPPAGRGRHDGRYDRPPGPDPQTADGPRRPGPGNQRRRRGRNGHHRRGVREPADRKGHDRGRGRGRRPVSEDDQHLAGSPHRLGKRGGVCPSRRDRGGHCHGPVGVEPGRRQGNAHPARPVAGLPPDPPNGKAPGHRSPGTDRLGKPVDLLPP
jgi:HAD superfamily hydrolase (TIGR01509 family)